MTPTLTIDMDRYRALRPDIRRRFDGWLQRERLVERHVVELTVGEGAVTITRWATDETGRVLTGYGPAAEFEYLTEMVLVHSLPPAEAFGGPERSVRP